MAALGYGGPRSYIHSNQREERRRDGINVRGKKSIQHIIEEEQKGRERAKREDCPIHIFSIVTSPGVIF